MEFAPIAAAGVAGVTAAAAYLDAKFHISKDLKARRLQKASAQDFARRATQDRRSLWYLFEEQVHRLPETEQAIWSRAGCYTWAETYAQSCRYGQFFLQNGLKPLDLVSFYLTNSPEFIFALLGSWAVGSAPAMINHHLAGDALVHCLKVAGGKILVVDEASDCRKRVEEVRDRIENELGMTIKVLDPSLKGEICRLAPERPDDALRSNIPGKFPIFLFYTSGTTGHPKACPFELQRAGALSRSRMDALGVVGGPNGDRFYVCMPLYHGTGLTTAISALVSGVTTCIGKKFSTSRFWNDIYDSEATAFVYVGETARYLLAAPPSDLEKKHKCRVMFGNGMRPDVWLRFKERFAIDTVAEFFNSTEGVLALLNVSRNSYSAFAVGHHGAIQRRTFYDVIIPVEIDHETNSIWRDPKTGFAKRKPYEDGGEILVRMPNEEAFVGYYKNPEATKKMFVRDIFQTGDLFYRTGDALRRTPDGLWYFLDRLGDTFRWKSENVSTAEVSECLGKFPGVVEANVYGVEVPGHDGRAGCAALYIDPALLATFDFNALLAHARNTLPKYAVPVWIRILSNLTTMHNNKQNKVPLRNDGIDLRKMQARADAEAKEKGLSEAQYDKFLFCPSALGNPKAGLQDELGFIEYTMEQWDGIRGNTPAALGAKL